jgi:DNA-binding transcriptional ArsR family regulator
MSFTVVYDACVLYPATLRDMLIELACTKLVHARWTDRIHDEWIRNVLLNRPDLKPQQLEATRRNMDRAVRGCLVTGYETLMPSLHLPDADDAHILAAAIRCNAQSIITFNLKDFPADILKPFGIEALHPDEFVVNAIHLNADQVAEAVRACQARLRNPPRTMNEHLERLKKQGLTRAVEQLEPYLL